MKYILILTFTLALNACAIFGDPTEIDDTRGLSAERIYQMGAEKMTDKDYTKAIEYFSKLESRYPHGKFATQAQLETALGQAGLGLRNIGGAGGSETHARQGQVDQFADMRFVIDDQHAAQLAARTPVASGN